MAFPWQLKRTSALSLLMRTSAILAIKVELPVSILIKKIFARSLYFYNSEKIPDCVCSRAP